MTLIMLLTGFRDGMYSAVAAYTDNMGADLIVTQSGGKGAYTSGAIPAAIHGEIASVSGAVEVEHVLAADIIFASGGVKIPAVLIGYNLQTGVGGPWSLHQGRAVQRDDEINLDTWLAHHAGIGLNDKVDVLGQRFTVVGLTSQTTSWIGSYIFVSRTAAEGLLQQPGIASFYLLRLPDGTDTSAVTRAIESQVDGVEALTPGQIALARRKTLASVIGAPINLMLVIGFITGIAVMGLTTHTAVVDRMREYGVLKAVGASGYWLRRLVIFETLCRAGMGFVLGIGLSYLAAQLIMRVFPQFTIIIHPETIGVVGLSALGMAALAALLPIRHVIAIDPAVVFKA
ncbi:MAG: ABC transporter permease [Chloroflexi bacterium]|nr:ABC transporter permease [Chloroflexota bacterium]